MIITQKKSRLLYLLLYLSLIRISESNKKFIHDYVGMNSRLDTIQASILSKKLKRLNIINKKRQYIARFYRDNINNRKIKNLIYSKSCVYHQYVILSKNRKKLIKLLSKISASFSFSVTKIFLSFEYQAGILCPHHNCLEMHQGCILFIH